MLRWLPIVEEALEFCAARLGHLAHRGAAGLGQAQVPVGRCGRLFQQPVRAQPRGQRPEVVGGDDQASRKLVERERIADVEAQQQPRFSGVTSSPLTPARCS